jgi:hypothetical protein
VGTLVASTLPGSALSEAISVALVLFVETVFGTGLVAVDLTTEAARGAGTSLAAEVVLAGIGASGIVAVSTLAALPRSFFPP